MIEESIINFFYNYNLVLAFVSGLAIGDLMIILGMLAGSGKANFFLIILCALIGAIIHDIIFYFLANTSIVNKLKKRFKLSKRKNKIAKFIESIGSGNYFLPLLLAKFIYGVRDAVIIYVSHNNKNLKKFILTIFFVDLIWLTTITSIGWLAGKGFTTILTLFKGFEKWLFVLVLGLISIYLINKLIISAISKYIKKLI